jgi:ribosomal-protein-serine acetyltransferase
MKQAIIKVDKELELRLPSLEHAEELFSILNINRSRLEPWLPWVERMQEKKDVFRFLQESMAFNQGGQKFISFVFLQNKLVGSLGLMRIDRCHKKAELGYWLAEAAVGKGVMQRSCQPFISFVFSKYELHRLEIRIPSNNLASKSIPTQMGFQLEGVLKESLFLSGQFCDTEIFSLLKKDWGNF